MEVTRARLSVVLVGLSLVMSGLSMVPASAGAESSGGARRATSPARPSPMGRAFVDHADPRVPRKRLAVPSASVPGGAWKPLGPSAIGPTYLAGGGFYGGVNSGRIDSLAVLTSGSHPGRVVAGSAGGGVWTSDDNGATWTARSDQAPSLAIGAMAVDASNNDHLIAGTGEAFQCGDCYPGFGVLSSTDGGTTWSVQDPGGVFDGKHIAQVAIDPSNSSQMFAATDGGLYVTTDGGTSWAKPSDASYATVDGHIQAVVIDPSTPATVYIGGGAKGVAKSSDGGVHWAASNTGVTLPAANTAPLYAMAVAASNPSTLYLSVGSTGAVKVYKTINGGSSWSPVAAAPDFTGQTYSYGSGTAEQGWYDNTIAVDPTNANHVVAGGIALVETTNGGSNWSDVNGQTFFGAGTNKIHPDQHAIAFRPDGKIWVGDDGGVYLYEPAGPTVTNANGNLNITQLYYGFNEVGGTVLAGSQDNASMRTASAAQSAWTGILEGDGGPSAITPNHTATQFIEADQALLRTTDGFVSGPHNITPPPLVSSNGISSNFTPPIAVIPNTGDPSNPTVFYGGADVYRTTNPSSATPTWVKVTNVSDYVSAFAVSPSNPSVVYAGFNGGTIQVSTDGGATFTSLAAQPFTDKFITGLSVDPTNPQAITVSVSFNDTRYSNGFPHVAQYSYTTTPGTGTWTVITGNLPNHAVSRVVYDNGALVAATDAGAYGTGAVAGGSTVWSLVGTGLPNVQVQDLFVDPTTSQLYAVTHGRGAWRLPVVSKPPAGYAVVSSPTMPAPAGVQTHGSVACPTGTKPVGGGVFTDSADLAVNVNSSYPTAKGWAGNLNNGSADLTILTIWAVCVKRPTSQFTVSSATFSSPPHSQEVGEVACPAGVVVGGGVSSTSKSLRVNITSTDAPTTTAWDGWINNVSKKTSSFTTFAICRNKKPAGYSIQAGAPVDNPSGADTYSNVTCPGASVPLSGGVYSIGTGLGQNLNTYAPANNTWYSYFNNADAVDNSVQTEVVCAGT